MSDEVEIDPKYRGPRHLSADIVAALGTLTGHLFIEQSECESHSVIVVQNFDNEAVLEATAVYLVSAIAQNIEANLQIREALFDESNLSRDLAQDVSSVIGASHADQDFRTMVRNPWIWEGISHMLLHLSRFGPNLHPTGRVLAKTSIKYDVHDHGLDVIALYEAGELGVSAGECKAYFDDPSRGISDAAHKLGEVDANIRDIEIRSALNQMRSSLDEDARGKLAGIFWRDERSYMPFVCCDDEHARNWTRNRKSMRRLNIPVSRKLLFPLSLPEARDRFDRICDFMRAYVVIEE